MNVFWPAINDSRDAKKACGTGAGMAFFVAVVTAVVAWLQSQGKLNMVPGIGKSAFLDAGLFFLIGLGLCFCSRIAAVAGLLLYLIERGAMIAMNGFAPAQTVSIVIFGLAFVTGVRGAFAWHSFKKAGQTGFSGENPGQVSSEVNPGAKKNYLQLAAALFIFAALAAGVFFFLSHRKSPASAPEKPGVLRVHVDMPPKPAVETVPDGVKMKLVSKSGRQFEGILTKKNDEGYWIYIPGTGEVFFSYNEIAEAAEEPAPETSSPAPAQA